LRRLHLQRGKELRGCFWGKNQSRGGYLKGENMKVAPLPIGREKERGYNFRKAARVGGK